MPSPEAGPSPGPFPASTSWALAQPLRPPTQPSSVILLHRCCRHSSADTQGHRTSTAAHDRQDRSRYPSPRTSSHHRWLHRPGRRGPLAPCWLSQQSHKLIQAWKALSHIPESLGGTTTSAGTNTTAKCGAHSEPLAGILTWNLLSDRAPLQRTNS